MPVPFSTLHFWFFLVRQQLWRVEYSEYVAENAMQHCLLSIAVRIHMPGWQRDRTYSHRPVPSSIPSSAFFFLMVFPPLTPLHRVSLPSLWLTLKDRVPCSVCHCLSAQEYQWPAAQSNQSLGGRSTVCLTSAPLIIVSKHKPINICCRLHSAATKTLESYLKPPVFEVIQATSTVARSTSLPENRGDGFLNGPAEKGDYLFWTQESNFWKITTKQLKLWLFELPWWRHQAGSGDTPRAPTTTLAFCWRAAIPHQSSQLLGLISNK